MKKLNVGASRPAADTAWSSAAHELVRRTLAQHGLDQNAGAAIGDALPNMVRLDELKDRFTSPMTGRAARAVPSTPGARFDRTTFSCRAGSRDYLTYVPASAKDRVNGVIMMLHGCTQTPEDFAAGTGMNALAEEHGLVIVYPAQSRGDNAQSCWNWFNRRDQQRGQGEPAILAGIAAKVCAAHGVGRERSFVAGLSAGAAMAVILGDVYGDVFAAVGAHSGLPAGVARDIGSAYAAMAGNAVEQMQTTAKTQPTRTIIFHGTGDKTVHRSNSDAIARRACGDAAQCIETTATGTTAGRSYTCTLAYGPDASALVEHWSIDGLGHAWSGGKPEGSYADTQGPDASAEMVRFFLDTPKGTI